MRRSNVLTIQLVIIPAILILSSASPIRAAGVISLVKDIDGPGSSTFPSPYASAFFVGYLGQLYFGVGSSAGAGNAGLWKSDGTPNNTVLVKAEVIPWRGLSFVGSYHAIYGGRLFFGGGDSDHGVELWVSDGTTNGTQLLADINPGEASSIVSNFTVVNGVLFFSADDGLHGLELWRTDGTLSGTYMVRDIHPSAHGVSGRRFVGLNGFLYFLADDGITGPELWKSDGTFGGTQLVSDILPGSFGSAPDRLTVFQNRIYMTAFDGVHGYEPWVSDGTGNGTFMLKDIAPGLDSGAPSSSFTGVNGWLVFQTYDRGLWRTNGTWAGTTLVHPGQFSNFLDLDLPTLNGSVFTGGWTPQTGWELWKSDATTSGTGMVREIYFDPDVVKGNILELTSFDGRIYFTGRDSFLGFELWESDGTFGGTVLTKDINPDGSSQPGHYTVVGNKLFFTADDGVSGRELWVIEGIDVPYKNFNHDLIPIWEDPWIWVFGYQDPERLFTVIEEALASDPALEDAVLTNDLMDLLTHPDQPVLLVPEDEVEAVLWIRENYELVYGERSGDVILFLEERGAGHEVLNELIETGEWGPPSAAGGEAVGGEAVGDAAASGGA